MPQPNDSPSITLYDRLAREITGQIERGVYRPGDRLPSVRQTHQEKNVSVSTVMQAYRLLEDQGIIEARPQSGYYVAARPLPSGSLPEPEISTPPLDPANVRTDALMRMVLRQANQEDLVQFGTAIPAPDLLPNAKLNRIMLRLIREDAYPWAVCPTLEGSPAFRKQVARKLARLNCAVSSEDVLVTSGCMEALSLALRATCKAGDLVAVESPTYFGILQALESAGLRALEIPTHWRDGLSLEALEFALEHHPVRAVMVVPNFQNPLGGCMPAENKQALVDLLARYEVPLIEDDIYGELGFGEHRPGLAKAYDREGLVITCSSFYQGHFAVLSHRLGGGGALPRADGNVEDDLEHRHAHPGAAGDRRISGKRGLRPFYARGAAGLRAERGLYGAGRAALLPRRHAPDQAPGRVCAVGAAARTGRFAGAVRKGAAGGHQHRPRLYVLHDG